MPTQTINQMAHCNGRDGIDENTRLLQSAESQVRKRYRSVVFMGTRSVNSRKRVRSLNHDSFFSPLTQLFDNTAAWLYKIYARSLPVLPFPTVCLMTRIFLTLGLFCTPLGLFAADDFKPEPGFVLLFNGKDLTGWKIAATKDKDKSGESLEGKTESPTKRFVVADGVIVVDPKAKGDLSITTDKTFAKDATIRFDFKPGKGCNNDLYFRGLKFDIKASDVKNLKEGEWNTFEISVVGSEMELKCNGESIRKASAKPAATPLSLRAEAGAIEYRRVRIKVAE